MKSLGVKFKKLRKEGTFPPNWLQGEELTAKG